MEFISHRPIPRRPIRIKNIDEYRNRNYIPEFVDYDGLPLVKVPEFTGNPLAYNPTRKDCVKTISALVLGRHYSEPILNNSGYQRGFVWIKYSLIYDHRTVSDKTAR